MKRFMPYFTLLFVVLTSTVIVWLPFLMRTNRSSMLDVYKQYDGPLYIIPAKTFYNPQLNEDINRDSSLPQSPLYFAAHLPLYPILIAVFAPLMGYLKSMIFVNVLCTILLSWIFYFMVKKLHLSKNPLLLTAILLFLPRFLVVRTTGAPESLFMVCIIASLYFFETERYFFAGILGALSVATKVPGILLFVAYGLVFVEKYIQTKKIKPGWWWIFLIPLALVCVFVLYQVQLGDFYAFFHTGGIVPTPYPFSVFNAGAKWVGTAWLEDILFYFFLYGIAVYQLKNSKHRSFYYFTLVFLFASICIQHRDISRYTLPLWPMAIIAFESFFTSKRFVIVGSILLIAIYLYAWNFLNFNAMPISEWLPFL